MNQRAAQVVTAAVLVVCATVALGLGKLSSSDWLTIVGAVTVGHFALQAPTITAATAPAAAGGNMAPPAEAVTA